MALSFDAAIYYRLISHRPSFITALQNEYKHRYIFSHSTLLSDSTPALHDSINTGTVQALTLQHHSMNTHNSGLISDLDCVILTSDSDWFANPHRL